MKSLWPLFAFCQHHRRLKTVQVQSQNLISLADFFDLIKWCLVLFLYNFIYINSSYWPGLKSVRSFSWLMTLTNMDSFVWQTKANNTVTDTMQCFKNVIYHAWGQSCRARVRQNDWLHAVKTAFFSHQSKHLWFVICLTVNPPPVMNKSLVKIIELLCYLIDQSWASWNYFVNVSVDHVDITTSEVKCVLFELKHFILEHYWHPLIFLWTACEWSLLIYRQLNILTLCFHWWRYLASHE